MTRRRTTKRIAAPLLALALLATAGASTAQAVDWTWSGSFSATDASGTFPLGIAVNQTTADVYVAEPFTPAFRPGHLKRFDSAGVLQGGIGFGLFAGVAVNQANGNVYASDSAPFGGYPPHIQTFTATGVPAAPPIFVPPNIDGAFPKIASDSSGNVYYPDTGTNAVHRFAPDGTPILPPISGKGSNALDDPRGVAVDSSGDIYVVDRIRPTAGDGPLVVTDGRVQRFNAAGKFKSVIADGDAASVAVDSAHRVFVGTSTESGFHVAVYKRSGAKIADFGLDRLGNVIPSITGQITINHSTGRVYVSDADLDTGGEVEMFDVLGKLHLVDRTIKVKHGKAKVKLHCHDGVCEAGELQIDARLKVGKHKQWITIGEASFAKLLDGQSATVEVELSELGEDAVDDSRHGLDVVISGTGLKPREVTLMNGW